MTPATTGPELIPMRSLSSVLVDEARVRAVAHLEREARERLRMVGAVPRHAGGDHVAVADRLDLLHLVAVDELVEAREQAIEKADDLARVEACPRAA